MAKRPAIIASCDETAEPVEATEVGGMMTPVESENEVIVLGEPPLVELPDPVLLDPVPEPVEKAEPEVPEAAPVAVVLDPVPSGGLTVEERERSVLPPVPNGGETERLLKEPVPTEDDKLRVPPPVPTGGKILVFELDEPVPGGVLVLAEGAVPGGFLVDNVELPVPGSPWDEVVGPAGGPVP